MYEIIDVQEEETYKYGISADEIDADDSSDRLRNQIKLFNLVANALRFIGRILMRDIPGREAAERLENEHIEEQLKNMGKGQEEILQNSRYFGFSLTPHPKPQSAPYTPLAAKYSSATSPFSSIY